MFAQTHKNVTFIIIEEICGTSHGNYNHKHIEQEN